MQISHPTGTPQNTYDNPGAVIEDVNDRLDNYEYVEMTDDILKQEEKDKCVNTQVYDSADVVASIQPEPAYENPVYDNSDDTAF